MSRIVTSLCPQEEVGFKYSKYSVVLVGFPGANRGGCGKRREEQGCVYPKISGWYYRCQEVKRGAWGKRGCLLCLCEVWFQINFWVLVETLTGGLSHHSLYDV